MQMPERHEDSVYELYKRGSELLSSGDHHAAIVPLSRARDLEPTKTSIREALGRALFHARRYEGAAQEFQAVAAAAPTNDYALFCLGRTMQLLGRHREACHPLALACSMAPHREDYRIYRDRARRAASLRAGEAPSPS
jgi:tetratricopeptide (TPR) repeat protein